MRLVGLAVVLAVSLALVPLAAEAQQANQLRRIGVLMHNAQNDPESTAELAAFRQGLQQLGWSENRNIRIDIRFAADRPEPMLAYAATRMPRTERLEWRQADATKLPFDDLQLFAPVARRIRFGGGIALFDRWGSSGISQTAKVSTPFRVWTH